MSRKDIAAGERAKPRYRGSGEDDGKPDRDRTRRLATERREAMVSAGEKAWFLAGGEGAIITDPKVRGAAWWEGFAVARWFD
jgi:hypothetical protein